MKVKDLIKELKKFNQNSDVILFGDGECFPALEVIDSSEFFVNTVEVSGGWCKIEEGDLTDGN